jgi:hypothetical protein
MMGEDYPASPLWFVQVKGRITFARSKHAAITLRAIPHHLHPDLYGPPPPRRQHNENYFR